MLTDGRLLSPSAERNKRVIGEVLRRILPARGIVLEVGSGTGQHVMEFARVMPHVTWQPTERDSECLRSISAWLALEPLTNVRAPFYLDVCSVSWSVSSIAAVVCINMIHIAPWTSTNALVRGARDSVSAGGLLFLYGPYSREGRHTSPSNEAFDAHLRAENPDWGVRDIADVALLANIADFDLLQIHEMPANNLAVVFQKRQ